MFMMVALATGRPMFDQFVPERPEPVLHYVGEGGRGLWARRMARICAAMGVSVSDVDVHPVFDVRPIASAAFQATLARDLREVKPGLVEMDPLYAYHGTQTSAMNLHEEGALLNMVSAPCIDAGSGLLVVNHMNQTGSGMSLKRITGAGAGEWADSWVLLEHREPPDVAAGEFMLTMDIGSRQWGGTTWNLDLSLGRFDEDTGQHEGDIAWDLKRATVTETPKVSATDRQRVAILDALADEPWRLSKTGLKNTVGGNHAAFDAAFGNLVAEERITHDKASRKEAGVTKTRLVWGLVAQSPGTDGPGWTGE
jgi:hypothetical protein